MVTAVVAVVASASAVIVVVVAVAVMAMGGEGIGDTKRGSHRTPLHHQIVAVLAQALSRSLIAREQRQLQQRVEVMSRERRSTFT
jgi:hypothetical protein